MKGAIFIERNFFAFSSFLQLAFIFIKKEESFFFIEKREREIIGNLSKGVILSKRMKFFCIFNFIRFIGLFFYQKNHLLSKIRREEREKNDWESFQRCNFYPIERNALAFFIKDYHSL